MLYTLDIQTKKILIIIIIAEKSKKEHLDYFKNRLVSCKNNWQTQNKEENNNKNNITKRKKRKNSGRETRFRWADCRDHRTHSGDRALPAGYGTTGFKFPTQTFPPTNPGNSITIPFPGNSNPVHRFSMQLHPIPRSILLRVQDRKPIPIRGALSFPFSGAVFDLPPLKTPWSWSILPFFFLNPRLHENLCPLFFFSFFRFTKQALPFTDVMPVVRSCVFRFFFGYFLSLLWYVWKFVVVFSWHDYRVDEYRI